jgi:hypothetical protein
VQVFGKPGFLFWQMDKAVLDHRGLGVHAHVRLQRVAGDRAQALLDQFLDQLGVRGFVLEQYDTGLEGLVLLAHRTFLGSGYFICLRSTFSRYRFLPLMPSWCRR